MQLITVSARDVPAAPAFLHRTLIGCLDWKRAIDITGGSGNHRGDEKTRHELRRRLRNIVAHRTLVARRAFEFRMIAALLAQYIKDRTLLGIRRHDFDQPRTLNPRDI